MIGSATRGLAATHGLAWGRRHTQGCNGAAEALGEGVACGSATTCGIAGAHAVPAAHGLVHPDAVYAGRLSATGPKYTTTRHARLLNKLTMVIIASRPWEADKFGRNRVDFR